MHNHLREGDGNAEIPEDGEDILVQLPSGGEDIGLPGFGMEAERDAAVPQVLDTHIHGRGEIEVRPLLVNLLQLRYKLRAQAGDICVIGDADVGDGQGVVLGAVLEVAYIGVVHDLQVSAGVLDDGGADADIADHAAEIIQDDDIPDAVLTLKDNEKSGDDILDQALGAESDDQSHDPDAGEHCCGIHAQDAEAPQKGDDHGKITDDTPEQVGHRGRFALFFYDKGQEHGQKTADDPDDKEGGDQRQYVGCCDAGIPFDEEVAADQLLHGCCRFPGQGKPGRVTEQYNQYQGNDDAEGTPYIIHITLLYADL